MSTTPITPTLRIEDLPDFETEPPGARPSEVFRAVERRVASRRRFLKVVGAAATTFGVATLEFRPLAAEAAPVLSVWSTCKGYVNTTTVCTPPDWVYRATRVNVCNGSWHRWDRYSGTNVSYRFQVIYTCASRNAWRWTGASGAGHTTKRAKCSDGYTSYAVRGGSSIVGNTICKTAI